MNDYNIEVLNLNNYITVVDIHIGFITNGVNNDFSNISKIDITEVQQMQVL
jgi:hypothetical protein